VNRSNERRIKAVMRNNTALVEAVAELRARVKKLETCSTCGGKGIVRDLMGYGKPHDCPACDATGKTNAPMHRLPKKDKPVKRPWWLP